jgi:hypothetical protein
MPSALERPREPQTPRALAGSGRQTATTQIADAVCAARARGSRMWAVTRAPSATASATAATMASTAEIGVPSTKLSRGAK